jgi:broad specificity phosphatase PhoE
VLLYNRKFLFIRHGEMNWNKARILQGHTDVPLNNLGRRQAEQALKALKTQEIASILASPLRRAAETANIMSAGLGLSVHYDSNLKERFFGLYEGRAWKYEFLLSDSVPDAEPIKDFYLRVADVVTRVLRLPGPVLIVSHGGIFNVISTLLCNTSDAYSPNAHPFLFSSITGSNECTSTPL